VLAATTDPAAPALVAAELERTGKISEVVGGRDRIRVLAAFAPVTTKAPISGC
jgi:hypothetical protein